MNPESITPLLLEILAKSGAILLLAACAVRMWRDASAAQRHLVWLAAIVAVLFLPMTRLAAPRWPVQIEQRTKVEVPLKAIAFVPVSVATELPGTTVAEARPHSWMVADWRKLALASWLAGTALLLGWRLLGSWRLLLLRRTSGPLEDARARVVAADVLRELKIGRRVTIRLSDECRVPMTWGSLFPVLMLPSEALAWSDARLAAALRHEAGHINRHDYLARWVAQFACALYWPNPLIWLAARALRVAQEQATDDIVLRAGTSTEDYAAQLFDVARAIAVEGFLNRHAVAMASASTLADRVLAIVDETRNRRPLTRLAAVAGAIAVALALGICTAAQLRGADKAPPAVTETPDAAAAKPGVAQILIETKFVEISDPASIELLEPLTALKGNGGVLSDAQFQKTIRALNQKKGVDLLSAPRVTTRSKQIATIEIIREFSYPTDWEKDSAAGWKPKNSETKNVGVTLEVEPEINADGTIDLRLKPSVVEFLGFIDLDAEKGKSGAKPTPHLIPSAPPDTRPGRRLQPTFSEQKMETHRTLRSGEAVVLSEFERTDVMAQQVIHRRLFVFVSAMILPAPADEAPATVAAPADAREGGPPAPASTAVEKAGKIVIPKIEFREASLPEAISYLQKKSVDLDPEHQGVNLVIKAPENPELKITISLTNVPLTEAVKYVATLSGLEMSAEPVALVLQPPGAKPAETAKPPVRGLAVAGTPEAALIERGDRIVFPKFDIRESTLEEGVELLRKMSVDFDPEKKGVNIVIKHSKMSRDARITVNLTNIPLREVLHYLAGLAGLEVSVDAHAILISPKPEP